MPRVLSMAPLYSLGHNDQNEVKHDFFNHVMPLVPALLSCDSNCIINGTISFIRWRQLIQGVIWLLIHVMLLAPVWASHATGDTVNGTISCSVKMTEPQCNMIFDHVIPVLTSHRTYGINNSTTTFLVQDDKNEMQPDSQSFNTVGTGMRIMWWQRHCQ